MSHICHIMSYMPYLIMNKDELTMSASEYMHSSKKFDYE